MKPIIIDVTKSVAKIELVLTPDRTSGQAVLVLTDDVQLASQPTSVSATAPAPPPTFHQHQSANGFPPRRLTEHTIVQILRENGGSVRIRDAGSGWNIYDEIAARLGVSVQARRRMTPGTGEPACRPEVGYCRRNLEQAGILEPTGVSGRGVWTLKSP